jgi:filamentous hemagglutinin family protein
MIRSRYLAVSLLKTIMGGVIVALPFPALAQNVIVPDNTLGAAPSLTRDNQTLIEGGARRGSNLFHSFQQFDVGEGQSAYFISPEGVQNIFSRVTGGDRSEILGTLGVRGGNANLFFMNPNGIIFGENSRLELTGSFLTTTADAIQFGEQGFFNTNDPQEPSQLLTVLPSAFLFSQSVPQSIQNQSTSRAFDNPSLTVGLQVLNGRSLSLLGGDIDIRGGFVSAFGGRIDIGSVGQSGVIYFNPDGSFSFPDSIIGGDVSLSSGAAINVAALRGGDIAITAENLTMSDNSLIRAGVSPGATMRNQVGNIMLNITQATDLRSASKIGNTVDETERGDSGNILIETGTLTLFGKAQLNTGTSSDGISNAGLIRIRSRGRILIVGGSEILTNIQGNAVGQGGDIHIRSFGDVEIRDGSGIFSSIGGNALGRGGNIRIRSQSLSIGGNSQLNASTSVGMLGEGDSGGVTIITSGNVSLDGNGQIFSSVGENANGNSRNIYIRANSLFITGGSQLNASTSGRGDSGNVIINVRRNVNLSGRGQVFSSVASGATGDSGNIRIQTNSLTVRGEDSQLNASTSGRGDSGDIIIRSRNSVNLVEGGDIRSGVDESENPTLPGNGGRIRIFTRNISITGNDSEIEANTFRSGMAGNIFISAANLDLVNGQVITEVKPEAEGQGGNIILNVRTLYLSNAEISTRTQGGGNAGTVNIYNTDTINLDRGSKIATDVAANGTGEGGDITISQSRSLDLSERSTITARSASGSDAGNIDIVLEHQLRSTNSDITTAADNASGGTITISAEQARLIGDSDIRTEVREGESGAGNITVNARNYVLALDDSDILAFANQQGGEIDLSNASVVFTENYQPAAPGTDPVSLDPNGRVDINADAQQPGSIITPSDDFIQNSLSSLPDEIINTDSLLANSCITRNDQEGNFTVTGSGGFPTHPGEVPVSPYPTGEVRSLSEVLQSSSNQSSNRSWQPGDAIEEPQGVYRLSGGRRVMSRSCQ